MRRRSTPMIRIDLAVFLLLALVYSFTTTTTNLVLAQNAKTLDCNSASHSVIGGAYQDYVRVESNTANTYCEQHKTITLKDFTLTDGYIDIKARHINTLIIDNVTFKMPGAASAHPIYAIYFRFADFSARNVTVRNCNFSGGETKYFVFFNGVTHITNGLEVSQNVVTQTGTKGAYLVTFSEDTGIGTVNISRNTHTARTSNASSLFNAWTSLNCSGNAKWRSWAYYVSLAGTNDAPPPPCDDTGILIRSNAVRYACESADLYGALQISYKGASCSLAWFEASQNEMEIASKKYIEGNPLGIVNFPELVGPSPDTPIRINVSHNFARLSTQAEPVMTYFWRDVRNVELVVADNMVVAAFRSGLTLVSLDNDLVNVSVQLCNNNVTGRIIKDSLRTNENIWAYMVYTGSASKNLNVTLSDNFLDVVTGVDARVNLIKTTRVASAGVGGGGTQDLIATVQRNEVIVNVFDNWLSHFFLLRGFSSFTGVPRIRLLHNVVRLTFTNATYTPRKGPVTTSFFAASVVNSTSSASFLTIEGNTLNVDTPSSGAVSDARLPTARVASFAAHFHGANTIWKASNSIHEQQQQPIIEISNNTIHLRVSGYVSLLRVINTQAIGGALVVGNTVACGYGSGERTCYGVTGVFALHSNESTALVVSSKTSGGQQQQYGIENLTVVQNTFDSSCAVADLPTSTEFYPNAAVLLRNATARYVFVSGNTLKQTHCPEGAQALRIEPWIDTDDTTAPVSFSFLPPANITVKSNSIRSNRCEPSCDFYAVFPFSGVDTSNTTSLSGYGEGAVLTLRDINAQEPASTVLVENNQLELDHSNTAAYDESSVVSFVSFCRNCIETNSGGGVGSGNGDDLGVKTPGTLTLLGNEVKCPSSSSSCANTVLYAYVTIALRLPSVAFGSQSSVEIVKNVLHDVMLQVEGFSLLPSFMVSQGGAIDAAQATFSWNCNKWSRSFQFSGRDSLCSNALECENVACFTETRTKSRTISYNTTTTTAASTTTSSAMNVTEINATINSTNPSSTTAAPIQQTTTTTEGAVENTTSPSVSESANTTISTASTTTTTTTTSTEQPPPPPPPTDRPRTETISLVVPPTTLPPPPVSAALQTSSTTISTASAAIALEPSAPMVAVRTLGFAIIATECEKNNGVIVTEDLQHDAPLEFPQSLMPSLAIGLDVDGHRRWLRGAVVANVLMVPVAIALIAILLASILDKYQVYRAEKIAWRNKTRFVKPHTDLYAKSRCFAILAVVLGIGIEGASFAMVCLMGQKKERASIKHDDDILMCLFCGIVPVVALCYLGISRVRIMLANSSCDPAVMKWGKNPITDVKAAASENYWKFLHYLFGSELWILRNKPTTQSFAIVARITPDGKKSEERLDHELKIYCQNVFIRLLPLFGRFKGSTKLEGPALRAATAASRGEEIILTEDEAAGNVRSDAAVAENLIVGDSLTAVTTAKQLTWKEKIDKFARIVAPYTYFVDLIFNALIGIIRGLVTINVISCGAASALVTLVMIAAAVYSVVVFPRISLLSGGLDCFINFLVVISAFMTLGKSASAAGFATSVVMILAVLSLIVSSTRVLHVWFKKVQMVPAEEDIANRNNDEGRGDLAHVAGSQNSVANMQRGNVQGQATADSSPFFLLENFISAMDGGSGGDYGGGAGAASGAPSAEAQRNRAAPAPTHPTRSRAMSSAIRLQESQNRLRATQQQHAQYGGGVEDDEEELAVVFPGDASHEVDIDINLELEDDEIQLDDVLGDGSSGSAQPHQQQQRSNGPDLDALLAGQVDL